MTTETEQDALNFKIGAVARITGIPADTLRMWERRYTVVSPRRGQGSSRLYSREDITRLTLIKQLVDRGSAISTVANLSREQLLEQLDLMQGGSGYEQAGRNDVSCRVMICGDALPLKMSGEANDYAGIEILGAYASMAEFEMQAAAQQPDVIVLEYPALMPETVSEIRTQLRRSGAKKAIVIYGFATREIVRSLHGGNTIPLRAPVDPLQLRQQCRQALFQSQQQHDSHDEDEFSDDIPVRLFNADELAQLAQASTAVECECPHHLVDIIQRLGSFEAYSAECENRSPEDAALHAYLHGATARVRATMEKALERVVRAEGVDLEQLRGKAVTVKN
ncbi:DNA-binding transcriptional MerR regulator [Methylohalomonas lacus]|uniref:DNA-binding transcriptional MerR regulator n=1 Tax=Methylohalomonas lacus TaxID=398773 RepID=A0AAE3HHP9_9GAMM|nr:MerR family transcriptional regulator [Methylohalomonas lacus]MCS3902479.1 DNA-binding transcriptional MerR regulator [Methylohalomonas lacus]